MPKKGFLAIAVTVAILVGPFLSASYLWTPTYKIRPLTANVTAVLDTAGATSSSYRLAKTTFAHVEKSKVFKNEISIDSTQEKKLESTFENLTVKVQVVGVGNHEFQVVKGGTVFSPLSTTFSLSSGTYQVKIWLKYRTKDITATKSDTFAIRVSMEEV